jgi:hypothetical protein
VVSENRLYRPDSEPGLHAPLREPKRRARQDKKHPESTGGLTLAFAAVATNKRQYFLKRDLISNRATLATT